MNSNSDVSFNGMWYKESTLPVNLIPWIYTGSAAVNDVFGPYFENNSYKLVKLHAMKMLPDSVQARHILLKVNSQAEVASAKSLADSLKNLIEKGADFAALARRFSKDTGSALNGGDLGWFKRGMMVRSFEDSAFSCNANQVKIAASQFGLHIIQTTKVGALSKQVQLAILERAVAPSTQTYQKFYGMAGKFASENTTKEKFDAAIGREKLTKKMAILHEADNTVSGIESPRPLIRAAFSAKVGTILKTNDGSPIFEMGNDFIIATLVGATEEGIAPLQSVKTRVELAVQKEKKAAVLAGKMAKASEGKSDLNTIASTLGCKINTASDITFNSLFLPDFGMEPAVIGTAVSIQPNVISSPVKGNSGVFVLKVTSAANSNDGSLDAEKARLSQEYAYNTGNKILDIHKKALK
ncbi:MAG TPA: peptidylprolyl isomerase, partial [Bacteroidales bacterium]|nr:peptidylprolyl isomerase [Bacteroidales bacterium]